jgi:hypothetical protein
MGSMESCKLSFLYILYHLPFLTLVTWIGIDDLEQRLDPVTQLTLLFDLEEDLYGVGARHFVFFTVPPFDRVPQSISPYPCYL